MEHWVGQGTLSRDRLLQVASLDVEYVKAEGDWLWMRDEEGNTSRVLDLVGGFGSSILGHHHTEVRRTLQSCLDANRPFHAQGSSRRLASDLKETLAAYLRQHTASGYEVLLFNTGTEAVEAALKHALLVYSKKIQHLSGLLANNTRELQKQIEQGSISIEDSFLRQCERQLGQEPIESIDQLLSALAAYNERVLNQAPFVAALPYAFHGKTMGSLAVTWNRDARIPFVRNNTQAVFVHDASEFISDLGQRTLTWFSIEFSPLRLSPHQLVPMSAFIYEPLRGEGGVLDLGEEEAQLIRDLKKQYPDVAIIADEVQCGLGRTGRPVESEALGLPNDYIALAKSLGGGLCKVSALAVKSELFAPEFSMLHTSTFADDDFSSAVAKRSIEIIQRDRIAERCAATGSRLISGLKEVQARYPGVLGSVRGRGCMIGIELGDFSLHPSAVLSSLYKESLLGIALAGYLLHRHSVRVLPSMGRRNVLRVQPSAYLDEEQIDICLQAIESACMELESGNVSTLLAHMTHSHFDERPRSELVSHPVRGAFGEGPADRIGFIAHLIDRESIRQIDPTLATLSDSQLNDLQLRLSDASEPLHIASRRVRSRFGKEVEFLLYGVMMDSEAIESDLRLNRSDTIRRHVDTAYRQARLDGCRVVGFGGYTSIVTANCTRLRDSGPAVTTGNSLTVASSLASMRSAAGRMEIKLESASVAIVGATGNIGNVHAVLVAQECGRLILIGRAGSANRLKHVAREVVASLCSMVDDGTGTGDLQKEVHRLVRQADTCTESDRVDQVLEKLLASDHLLLAQELEVCQQAQIIICASNSATPILDAHDLAEGKSVLVCDLAIPGDVDHDSVSTLPNVRVIRGGVVNLPLVPDFNLPGMKLNPGQIYACAGETLLLGLAGMHTDFSRGAIQPSQVKEIAAIAKVHGFQLDHEKLVSGF